MRVTIASIDTHSRVLLGNMQMSAFATHFESATFAGSAWFVSASGQAENWVGQTFDVEIEQEAVTQFAIEDAQVSKLSVEPESAPKTYRVVGVVTSVVQLEKPTGEAIFTVSVGDAAFTLERKEIGQARPERGMSVNFLVHDISLWDEAI